MEHTEKAIGIYTAFCIDKHLFLNCLEKDMLCHVETVGYKIY